MHFFNRPEPLILIYLCYTCIFVSYLRGRNFSLCSRFRWKCNFDLHDALKCAPFSFCTTMSLLVQIQEWRRHIVKRDEISMPIVSVLTLRGKTQLLRFPYKFQHKKVWKTFECVKLCKFGITSMFGSNTWRDSCTTILTYRRIVDDGVKENGFSIITENRTYHVIAESTNDWK